MNLAFKPKPPIISDRGLERREGKQLGRILTYNASFVQMALLVAKL